MKAGQLLRAMMAGLLASALAACASSGGALALPAGTAQQDVLAKVGRPTRTVPLPGGGERLQYSLQPWGRQAYVFDFDAQHRLVRARQVLTSAEFSRIEPGTWTRADVEREFGPPAWTDQVASFQGTVMTYRWYEAGEMFYWVYLDPQGVVQRSHPGIEHLNAPNDRS